MTTEKFSKSEFEDVLTDVLDGHGKTWSCIGMRGGEYRYAVSISKYVYMMINSSIGSDGFAADTGENSIRVWLVDHLDNSLGSKTQRWIDRRPHWQGRLKKAVSTTLFMGGSIEYCPNCATVENVFIVKKEGKNKGRMFVKCQCEHSFTWLDMPTDDDEQPKPAVAEQPAVKCPKCGSAMILRTRKSDGKQFYGCTKYPACNGTVSIPTIEFGNNGKVSTVDAESKAAVEKWVEMKNKCAEREVEQERAAFASDPDFAAAEVKVMAATVKEHGTAAVLAAIEKSTGISTPKTHKWSPEQEKFFETVANLEPGQHVVLQSGAGTGKTTTIAQSTRLLPSNKKIVVLVFNKHNVQPVVEKVPSWVKVCTYNSLGNTACMAAWKSDGAIVDVEGTKTKDLLESALDKRVYGYLFPAIRKLVGLVKANLTGTDDADLLELVEYYDIEVGGDAPIIFQAVRFIIAGAASNTRQIEFDDQCWLPIVHNLQMEQYDYVYVDEAQDTNKCQLALALASVKPDGHILAVGDPNQSMYAFRGADAQAIPNLIETLDAMVLPLSKTFRNPECIVELVNKKFSHIQFTGTGKDGSISNLSYEQALVVYKPGDMVLCRTNAPLVAPVFDLIRRGVKAIIRGRDIGKGLLSLMKKMKASDVTDLVVKLQDYRSIEVPKLLVAEKTAQAQNLDDKIETIIALSDGITSLWDLENRITSIFDDKIEGVVFSSIHKAKGLEAENVYLLAPDLLPHPMAKKDWEKVQEQNIEYVALTRALVNLIYVPQKARR